MYDLLATAYQVSTQVLASIFLFRELHSFSCSSDNRPVTVATTKPRIVAITTSNSSQQEPADILVTTETATETTTTDVLGGMEGEEGTEVKVKLSLWLQWTLLKVGIKLYGKDTTGRGKWFRVHVYA